MWNTVIAVTPTPGIPVIPVEIFRVLSRKSFHGGHRVHGDAG